MGWGGGGEEACAGGSGGGREHLVLKYACSGDGSVEVGEDVVDRVQEVAGSAARDWIRKNLVRRGGVHGKGDSGTLAGEEGERGSEYRMAFMMLLLHSEATYTCC